jgi:hypothetical protein
LITGTFGFRGKLMAFEFTICLEGASAKLSLPDLFAVA